MLASVLMSCVVLCCALLCAVVLSVMMWLHIVFCLPVLCVILYICVVWLHVLLWFFSVVVQHGSVVWMVVGYKAVDCHPNTLKLLMLLTHENQCKNPRIKRKKNPIQKHTHSHVHKHLHAHVSMSHNKRI